MTKKKVFILFPDGGGLRNFAFSNFKTIGEQLNFDIVYWNNSKFPIKNSLGFNQIKIKKRSINALTPLYSLARKHIELNISKKKFKDPVYDTYKFPLNFNGRKNKLKSLFVLFLIRFYASEKGLARLRQKIENLERKNPKYKNCKSQLKLHKPDLVFCSNQRNTQAISPLLAAKDLGITTVCFIQSWDNVPKAMQVVQTDYYLVWSNLMREELLKYYPFIHESQVFVTGTPQFEMHYNTTLLQSRETFFNRYHLDINKKYICFSGDDETTSPLDQYYLEDLSDSVRRLNSKGENLGIIFRKCPFDISQRYNAILEANKDIIKVLTPYWKQIDNKGDMMPLPEDSEMLYNVCEHSAFVTNVCSSTVFDFVAHNKPCLYYNYEQPQLKEGIRDIGQNYNYVHFRSMPSPNAVIFCTDKKDLDTLILNILNTKISNVSEGLKWYDIVVGKTPDEASEHIWDALNTISNNK